MNGTQMTLDLCIEYLMGVKFEKKFLFIPVEVHSCSMRKEYQIHIMLWE